MTIGLAHIDLDERAGQLFGLPRSGGIAGAQPDHGVADPHRLAGVERDIAGIAIALVQHAEHGDPLRHRRCALFGIARLRGVDGDHAAIAIVTLRRGCDGRGRLRDRLRLGLAVMQEPDALPPAGRDHRRQGHAAGDPGACHPSGAQAS